MPNSPKILKSKPLLIIGIDPGYERLGVALIEKNQGKEVLVHSECFQTSAKKDFVERLFDLGARFEAVVKKFGPEALAIENLFLSSNQKTAMRVGEVRGAILYLALKYKLSIHEYTPLQVKIAVTGYGRSDKRQVEQMVRRLIHIEKKIFHDDEIDAIAIALCAAASIRLPT